MISIGSLLDGCDGRLSEQFDPWKDCFQDSLNRFHPINPKQEGCTKACHEVSFVRRHPEPNELTLAFTGKLVYRTTIIERVLHGVRCPNLLVDEVVYIDE